MLKRGIVIFLSLCVVISTFQLSAIAANEKIDVQLLSVMKEKSDEELIPVWLWLKEFDNSKIADNLMSKKGINASIYESEKSFNTKMVSALTDNIANSFENTTKRDKIFPIEQRYLPTMNLGMELVDVPMTYADKLINDNIEEYIHARREIVKQEYSEYNSSFINKHLKGQEKKLIYNSKYTPTLVVNATKKEIETYAKDNKVESISLYTPIRLRPDYHKTIDQVYAGQLEDGTGTIYKGTGVNIGIIEANYYIYLSVAPQLKTSERNGNLSILDVAGLNGTPIGGASPSNHATGVTSIIAGSKTSLNGNTYEGIVPLSTVYQVPVGNTFMDDTLRAIQELVDRDVCLINFSASDEGSDGGYNEFDKEIDRIIASTGITFVNTPGNGPKDNAPHEYVHSPGKSLNAITVANAATKTDVNTLNAAPYQINSNVSYISEEYIPNKPDIAAPGTNINFPINRKKTDTQTGTSFAAPVVTGIIAQMMQANPWLKTNPVAVKSKLLLAADYNKISSTNNPVATDSSYLYDKSGAGLIDAIAAVNAAQSSNGIDMFINSLKEQKSNNYYFKAGQKLRAVMVYSKENTNLINSKDDMDIVDFHLRKSDGTSVASSISDRNNVRIIEYQFDEDGFYYFSANPRQLTNNEGETDYAGVKAHISFQFSNLTANIIDLEYDGSYYFTSIKFIDDMLEYRNKQIYVVINRYDTNSTVTEVANATININNAGVGLYNSNGIEFGEDEYVEILMYEDKGHQNQIARELVN